MLTRTRLRVIAGAFVPTTRAAPVRSVAAVAALAVTPTAITVARDGHDLSVALLTATLLTGAGLGYAADDDAAAVLAASPTTLAVRRTLRMAGIATISMIGWATAAAIVVVAGHPVRLGADRIIDLVTVAGLALAAATSAHRRGLNRVGFPAAVFALLSVLTVTAFASRFHWLPTFMHGAPHTRWLWIAVVGWVVAAHATRDLAAR